VLFFADFAHVRRSGRPISGADEIDTIDRVLVNLEGLNGRQVSDLLHEEPGGRLVHDGDTIPYEAALVGARQTSTPTSRHSQDTVAERFGLARST